MTNAVKIYHNPRCSKSRETLSLLQSNGIEPDVVLYLETPPDADTIKALLQMLGMDREMRTLFVTLDKLDHASITAQRKLTIPFVKDILAL